MYEKNTKECGQAPLPPQEEPKEVEFVPLGALSPEHAEKSRLERWGRGCCLVPKYRGYFK